MTNREAYERDCNELEQYRKLGTVEECREAVEKQKAKKPDIYNDINRNGCSDPFWPDGCNMNLTRNHIIYAKRQIAEICEDHGIPIPDEMYLPTPPEVNDYYMANLKQKRRVEMIGNRDRITTKKNKYDREQLSLF